MRCGKRVRLPGGFIYEVRSARKVYTCHYCRGDIRSGQPYVAERVGRDTRRYHLRCFNQLMPHRLVVAEVSGELRLCYVLRDDSAL
jgi:hypothetical protein